MQGLNLGIDFTGGTILQISIPGDVKTADVRGVLEQMDMANAEVQKSGDQFYIRTTELTQEQTDELMANLKTEFKDVEFLSAESVGATIGKELTRNAILAVAIAAVLMLVYITVRFEWTFGVAAVLGILHNVLIVLSIFALLRWEVNSDFIAAILTVIGYSINDTIVIFDRVRENLREKRKENNEELINRSVTQTINRSLNTGITAMTTLIFLLIFGGETIEIFVLTMLIGFVCGTYSSICIASPLWYDIKNRQAA